MLEIIEPGLLATVQDAGRPGLAHLGVPRAGAADPWSLRVANALLDNDPGDALVELTFAGARLRALEPTVLGLAGADLGGHVDGGSSVPPGRVASLASGEVLTFGGADRAASGARAYLSLPGGVDVPEVLGSRATCLRGAFGGLNGRALRAGDAVRGCRAGELTEARDERWPGSPITPRHADPVGTWRLRVLRAPPELWSVPAAAADAVFEASWTVSPASDRMGLRLDGGGPAAIAARSRPSHGVTFGTIQLPPDGRPIVLGVDHQPTGGYPVLGAVISADLPALGQLVPGDAVRFVVVDVVAARAALETDRAAFRAALDALRGDARWSDLWRSAGA